MTARQSRRSQRRKAPADSLPRIGKGTSARGVKATTQAAETAYSSQREHRVSTDYRYVRREMAIIGAVGVATFGFIVVMSFIV